jgi:hypothetical protein
MVAAVAFDRSFQMHHFMLRLVSASTQKDESCAYVIKIADGLEMKFASLANILLF